jgi:hypothetical protein
MFMGCGVRVRLPLSAQYISGLSRKQLGPCSFFKLIK